MATENRLLALLPREIYEKLAPNLKQVSLERGTILHHPGETIKDLYFPIDRLLSIAIAMNHGSPAEAGIVGNCELIGVNAFMGGSETTHTEYIVQMTGSAIKADAQPLLEEFDRHKKLRDVLLRYTQAAQKLQAKGLIHYYRGHVQILDQQGLEAVSCECFRTVREEYDRLLGDKDRDG